MIALIYLSGLPCLAVCLVVFVSLARNQLRRSLRAVLASVCFLAGVSLAGMCHAVEHQRPLTGLEASWYPFAGITCVAALGLAIAAVGWLHSRYPPRRHETIQYRPSRYAYRDSA